jgi:beta-galactosidase
VKKMIAGNMLLLLIIGGVMAAFPGRTGEVFIPVSVWYSGGKARAPMLTEIDENSREEWKRDLEQIRQLGFNTVRTWVEWAHCEKEPGEFDFENLKLLSELAGECGLKVFVQIYADSAPDWVGKRYPDAQFEAQSGDKIRSQAAPGYNTDHPGVRQAVQRFYTETARVASSYPNHFGYDLWSEPHIVNWAIINYIPNPQFGYSEPTQKRFREWLKEKYGSLEALNRAWYRGFDSWEDVQAPRFGTILSYTDFIDWKTFIPIKLAGDLWMRAEAVRAGDPDGVITAHAAVPSIFYSPVSGWSGYGLSDDFLMAESVDYYGTSLYPKHSFPKTHWELWKFQVAAEFSRCANIINDGFYVGELQAGYGTRGLVVGNPVTKEDHRLWFWSVLARGARAVNFYAYYPMSSGYESGGYGLIHLDGTLTERARAAGKMAQVIQNNLDLFHGARPVKAEVALVYNPLSQMVGGEQQSGPENGHRDSLFGYYRALLENHIPVDFIHRMNLEQGNYDQYKLIILPYSMMFTREAAKGVKDFVQAGGMVVAEARMAWNDSRGFAEPVIPGMGLDEVFGVRETRVQMVERPGVVFSDSTDFANVQAGGSLEGAYFQESLEVPAGGRAKIIGMFEDGDIALTLNQYGQGQAMMIGSFLGLAYHQEPTSLNRQFIRNLLDVAGIQPPLRAPAGEPGETPVEIRLMEHPEGRMIYFLNHSGEDRQVEISLNLPGGGPRRVEEILTGESVESQMKDGLYYMTGSVPARDVRIYGIKND